MEDKTTITDLRGVLHANMVRLAAAEAALYRELPAWIRVAQCTALQLALQNYLDLVQDHIARLNTFLDADWHGVKPVAGGAFKVLTAVVSHRLQACASPGLRDACLVAGIQAINHYKICGYGTGAAHAAALEMAPFGGILYSAASDERDVDERLSHLARHEINTNAAKGSGM